MFQARKALVTILTSAVFIRLVIAAPARPEIRSFASSLPAIDPSTAAQLRWSATGAITLSLDQGVGDVTGRDWIYVSPARTTTYTLTAINAGGSVRRQLTLRLNRLPPAPLGKGATYYVSPIGNDTNDGRSPQTAWRTAARVNGCSLRPGDNVLFQRGGEWRESLKAPTSGEAGNPITFADYGTGTKPKFWGSVILANKNFRSAGGSLYTYSIATPVLAALADHTFFYYKKSHDAPPEPHFWSYDGSTLTVNSPGSDPRFNRKTYTAVVREDVVYSNYKNHLAFYNLVVDESAAPDGGYAFRIMGSQDVVLDQCEAYRAGKHHFGVINSTRVIGRNLYAGWAMPGLGHGGAIAYVSYGDASSSLSDQTSEWHNCVWDHAEDPQDNDSYYSFYCHGTKLTSVLVDQMVSLGGNFSVGNEGSATKVLVHGGLVQNARVEVYGRDLLFDGMRIAGQYATLDMIGSDLTFQNMIIEGTNLSNAWYQSAVVSRGTGNTLRFSTIAVDRNAPPYTTCIAIDTKANAARAAKFSYYGNILLAPGRVVKQWNDTPAAADFADVRYNFYSPQATFNDREMNLAQWQAWGLDRGSRQGDPMFEDRANGDYRLQKGSPAINGVPTIALFQARYSIPDDSTGVPRKGRHSADMGAIASRDGGLGPVPAKAFGIWLVVLVGLAGGLAVVLRRRKRMPTSAA